MSVPSCYLTFTFYPSIKNFISFYFVCLVKLKWLHMRIISWVVGIWFCHSQGYWWLYHLSSLMCLRKFIDLIIAPSFHLVEVTFLTFRRDRSRSLCHCGMTSTLPKSSFYFAGFRQPCENEIIFYDFIGISSLYKKLSYNNAVSLCEITLSNYL